MKVTIADIPKRINVTSSKNEGILNYDVDNAYPQRMMRLIGGSGTARNCVRLYSTFLAGKGFKDLNFFKTILNKKGETADKILRKITEDWSTFGGIALHFNYSLTYKIIEINIIPFEHTRLPDSEKVENRNKIAVYDDWAKEFCSRIKREKVQWIDRYDPRPEIIQQQIENVGGIQNWKGQIYWISNEGENSYPTPIYDPIVEDIDTDAEIKIHRNSNVRTGFSASHIFVHKGKFESEDKRDEFNEKIAEFQGADVAGSMMVIEAETEEQIPSLLPVESQLSSRVIDITNTNTKNSIIEAFGQPPELFPGNRGSGITFSNDAIRLAYDYYNTVTKPERIFIEELFSAIIKNFEINSFTDLAIDPLTFGDVVQTDVLAVKLGVGSTQSLKELIVDTTLTPPQKINVLQLLFGLSGEQAKAMVEGTPLSI